MDSSIYGLITMVEIKITESDIKSIIDEHELDRYIKNWYNLEINPKEVIYQIELTELDKCKKLTSTINCLIYNTIVKTARKEHLRLEAKKK